MSELSGTCYYDDSATHACAVHDTSPLVIDRSAIDCDVSRLMLASLDAQMAGGAVPLAAHLHA
ncbi:hypothetical protein [Xanthomonas campestris]|uniref:hypothetical protein n=1 Tax=Xanthomonas campestris TaxID=339 RepID=UPI00388DB656